SAPPPPADPPTRSPSLDHQHPPALPHGFNLTHARHPRMARKMPLEKRLVDGYRFDADAFGSAFVEADDPVDHQKGITMRQNPHDLFTVESAVAFRHDPWHRQRVSARLFFRDRAGQFGIRSMPRFHRDEMAA